MDTPLVHIVIINFNSSDDCIECVESLLQMDYPNFNVYILDNLSKNEEIEKLLSWGNTQSNFSLVEASNPLPLKINSIVLLKSRENLGFGGGNNIVLNQLKNKKNEFIWLLNPDMIVSKNALLELTGAKTGIQIQATPTYMANSKDKMLHLGVARVKKLSATVEFIKNSNKRFDYINGGSMFFSCELLKVLDLFPEKYFLYWEETHWCKLARQKNVDLKINYNVKVWDKGSTSIGKGMIAEYYYTRNGLIYRKEFEAQLLLVNILMHIFRFLLRIISMRFKRAQGIMLGLSHFIIGKTGKL
ncbi:glycosyltransferase family 2 protein [Hyphobacterium sp. CCMP332]|nr:glycosyltransferase family 2 protein [Hyphobacterium sp. CCMP332]